MPRRRPLARAAALLTPLVLLAAAACSGGDGSDGGSASSSSGASSGASASGSASAAGPEATSLDAVTVTDAETGTAPTVTVDGSLAVDATQTKVLRQGDGPAINPGDLVEVDFVGVDGTTGEQFGATEFDGSPTSFLLGGGVIKGFTTALAGRTEGSRVLTAIPPAEGYGPAGGLPQAKIGADDTLVYLVDVRKVAPGHAVGEPVTPPPGLPAVSVDPTTHVPTTTPATGAPPSGLVVQPLVEGAGPVVEEGQTVTVMYTGAVWGSAEPFDSSWTKQSAFTFPVGQGQVIKGWDQGVVGHTVGSQLLLVIPPELGYGAEGSGEAIPGGSTLVFVVDVLAAQ